MTNRFADIVTRQNNAYDKGVEIIQSIGSVNEETAKKVVDYYLKHKLAKLDVGVGAFKVKHGAYLDADVIARAVAIVN